MTSAPKVKPALDPPEKLNLDGRRASIVGVQRATVNAKLLFHVEPQKPNLSTDHILLIEAGDMA